jgi:NADPH:quinone reductase-like Zn-dependent oxidoreductase
MRAIQITQFGRPEDVVRVVELQEPPAPGPGEVKVAVELSPLNKHDLLRATDETDLRATLDTLPTRKWQTPEISELRPHPSDPALP